MMKFKIFEKLDPDYSEIDYEEYGSILSEPEYSDFTSREIREIRKFLASKGIFVVLPDWI